jgi:hypothetical protein
MESRVRGNLQARFGKGHFSAMGSAYFHQDNQKLKEKSVVLYY